MLAAAGPKPSARMLADGWANVVEPGCRAEEIIDAGEHVVVRWRGWGNGRTSVIPVETRYLRVWDLTWGPRGSTRCSIASTRTGASTWPTGRRSGRRTPDRAVRSLSQELVDREAT